MNYTSLPPGRIRGLEYSNYLSRRRRLRRAINISPIRTITTSVVSYPVIVQHSPITNHSSMRINRRINDDYMLFSQLQDVKIGLLTKKLLTNSSVKLNKCENNFCVICQDDIIVNEDIIREIKCSHSFHVDCIDNWFSENKKCPTCKYELA